MFAKKLMAVFFPILFCVTANCALGQSTRQNIEDVFRELESRELTLWFFNALDGTPLVEAKVEIENFGAYTSNYEGKIIFKIPPDGSYEVRFEKSGYIKSVFRIEIMAGTLFFNRFSVSPTMPIGTLRVALDWGEEPRDLDAHLMKQGGYHISYRNKKVSADGVARLDRDDNDSFGPETITANTVDENGVYRYFVHDYTNRRDKKSRSLSNSKASVKVYGGDNKLLNVFKIPENLSGVYWHVFTIENGEVIQVMKVGGKQPGF